MPKTLIDQKLETLIQQGTTEVSRRLYCRLAQCDADLRALEDSITSPHPYSLEDYDLRFRAITTLREQTKQEIDKMIEHDRA